MTASRIDERDVTVSGNATADDVAAVLAALRELAARTPVARPYDQWRAQRIDALRAHPAR